MFERKKVIVKSALFVAIFSSLLLLSCPVSTAGIERELSGSLIESELGDRAGASSTYISSISTGWMHSFIVKSDGTLWGSGSNSSGKLGLGNTGTVDTYTLIATSVMDVKAGFDNSLMLKKDGSLWATGDNSYGQLGTGDKNSRTSFVKVLDGVKSFFCGSVHSLALKTDGTLWAAGSNRFGQLGTGNNNDSLKFIKVLSGVKSLSTGMMGQSSMVIKTDNTLYVTGRNDYGQLGLGDKTNRNKFTLVASNVSMISNSTFYSMVIINNVLSATGRNNFGQLGLGDVIDRLTFTKAYTGVSNVVCGYSHTMMTTTDNYLMATGNNDWGQLGLGTITSISAFTPVMANVSKISCGTANSMVIQKGVFWVCGANSKYIFGMSDYDNILNFTAQVSFVSSLNGQYVCADGIADPSNYSLYANRSAIGAWELFHISVIQPGTITVPESQVVAIKAMATKLYCCAENAGTARMTSTRTQIGQWEKFVLYPFDPNFCLLQSFANNGFVRTDSFMAEVTGTISSAHIFNIVQ